MGCSATHAGSFLWKRTDALKSRTKSPESGIKRHTEQLNTDLGASHFPPLGQDGPQDVCPPAMFWVWTGQIIENRSQGGISRKLVLRSLICTQAQFTWQGPWLSPWAWSQKGMRFLECLGSTRLYLCMWEEWELLWPHSRQGDCFFHRCPYHYLLSHMSFQNLATPLPRDGVQCPLLKSGWVCASL